MIKAIADKWRVLMDALGQRRYVLGDTASSAAAIVLSFFAAIGLSAYFSQWALTIAAFIALALWIVLGYANDLRERLVPSLKISYDDKAPDCRKTIELRDQLGSVRSRRSGRSLRLRVECKTDASVSGCMGNLIKIEFRPPNGQFSSIPFYEQTKLHWSLEEPNEFKPLTIHPEVPRHLGVIRTEEDRRGFRVSMHHRSYVTPESFTEIGEYRFHVRIVSESAPTVPMTLQVEWNGKWEDIHAAVVSE